MLDDPQVRRVRRELHRPVVAAPQAGRSRPGQGPLPRTSTTRCGTRCGKNRNSSLRYILRNNRSVLELLDSDYTFVNERLARHYGIDGVKGDEFRQVALADRRRGGVLTQASVLTLTSNPNRTSPVKRGQWILQQLLGTPPPPPPPDVAKLDESQAGRRRRVAARAHGGAPDQAAMRLVPSADGPARASRSRITTPSGAGGPWTAGSRSIPPES